VEKPVVFVFYAVLSVPEMTYFVLSGM